MGVSHRDSSLDNVRLLAAFAVVLTHAAAILGMQRHSLGDLDWWVSSGFYFAARWCVPVWVMLSGALLLGSSRTEGLREFYSRRATRVLLPLLAWSLIYSIWVFARAYLKGEPLPILEQIVRCVNGNSYYHMWYLYMVVFLYLFTPFFRMIVRHATPAQLWFLVVVGFVFQETNLIHAAMTSLKPGLFINGFLVFTPYYFLGHLLMKSFDRIRSAPLVIGVIVSFVIGFAGWKIPIWNGEQMLGFFHSYISLPVISMSTCLFLLFKRMKRPFLGDRNSEIAQATLGIYLLHAFVLDVVGRWLLGFKLQAFFLVPMAAILVFLISGAGAILAQKFKFLRWMV